MKCGARVALGVAGGYFLGRTKKMKLAMMLAGMAAGRQAGGPGALLSQGKSLLNASPELSKLSDELRGRLLDAGKGAALAVATRQVESLTDRVAGRVAKSLGDIGGEGPSKKASDDDADDVTEADEQQADESEHEDEPEDEPAEEPAAVGSRSGGGAGGRSKSAPTRRAPRADAGSRVSDGARSAARRTAGAASGTRRAAGNATGRATRARSDNSG